MRCLLLGVDRVHRDEEVLVIEDLVADFVEAKMTMRDELITHDMVYSAAGGVSFATTRTLHQLIALSEVIDVDSVFARQARRKAL